MPGTKTLRQLDDSGPWADVGEGQRHTSRTARRVEHGDWVYFFAENTTHMCGIHYGFGQVCSNGEAGTVGQDGVPQPGPKGKRVVQNRVCEFQSYDGVRGKVIGNFVYKLGG
jgi:hypothetical protein